MTIKLTTDTYCLFILCFFLQFDCFDSLIGGDFFAESWVM